MHKLNIIDWLALGLTVVGGVNWGLVALFQFDLVSTLLGDGTLPAKVVYCLVALSSLFVGACAVRRACEHK